jgi:hypothetical protein
MPGVPRELVEHALNVDPKGNDNDACATNSTSCEASILKENIELRAQLEFLTSNMGNWKKVMKSYLALMRIF